jgi:hypothetical protein
MRIDRISMFTYLISKLSKESVDELQGHKDWTSIEALRDPLRLWKIIKEYHQTLTTSKVASVIKKLQEKNMLRVARELTSQLSTTSDVLMPG